MDINEGIAIPSFQQTLADHDIELVRGRTTTLQVNVGRLCNQACLHCHLEAGPLRGEIMTPDTIDAVIDYAGRCSFDIIDITGGAPEMNPHITRLVEGVASLAERVIFRCNLTSIAGGGREELLELLSSNEIAIIASLPALNAKQTDSQRGEHVFEKSLEAIERLNSLGYGEPGTGLELDIVSNPAGAFLPPAQKEMEERFREVMQRKWGLHFSSLFNFANVPLGRFRRWLEKRGALDSYCGKLVEGFNPCATDGVMCRTLVSVDWDGYLYDCDFNIAVGLHMGGERVHVSEMAGPPEPGSPIATADHCYTCTAGAGFT